MDTTEPTTYNKTVLRTMFESWNMIILPMHPTATTNKLAIIAISNLTYIADHGQLLDPIECYGYWKGILKKRI